jgi:hypothetical protein
MSSVDGDILACFIPLAVQNMHHVLTVDRQVPGAVWADHVPFHGAIDISKEKVPYTAAYTSRLGSKAGPV